MASRESLLRSAAQTIAASVLAGFSISNITRLGNTSTATIGVHPFIVGDNIQITGVDPSDYNGLWTVSAIATNTVSWIQFFPAGYVSGGLLNYILVGLGIADQGAGTDFFQNIKPQGFHIVLPAKNSSWNGQTGYFDILLTIRMYFTQQSDGATQDFKAIEDVWTAVRDALKTTANWTAQGQSAPDSMTITGPTPRSDLKPMVFMYEIDMVFPAHFRGEGVDG